MHDARCTMNIALLWVSLPCEYFFFFCRSSFFYFVSMVFCVHRYLIKDFYLCCLFYVGFFIGIVFWWSGWRISSIRRTNQIFSTFIYLHCIWCRIIMTWPCVYAFELDTIHENIAKRVSYWHIDLDTHITFHTIHIHKCTCQNKYKRKNEHRLLFVIDLMLWPAIW